MYAAHGRGDARPAQRDLRVRDLGRRARRALPGPRSPGRQAALLHLSTTGRSVLRLGGEGAAARAAAAVASATRRSADYLTFLWVPDPDTIFEGVCKLPPGHCATFADGRLDIREYWDLSFAPEERAEREWAERVRDCVGDAVRQADGLGRPARRASSAAASTPAPIVATMQDARRTQVTHLHGRLQPGGPGRTRSSPTTCATRAAWRRELRTSTTTSEILEPDIVDLLPKLVWHMDEPVADPAAITTYLICAAARERLTVILSGMGGDEIFAGYPRHLAAQLAPLADVAARVGARARLEPSDRGRADAGPAGPAARPAPQPDEARCAGSTQPARRALPHLLLVLPSATSSPALLSPELRARARRPRPVPPPPRLLRPGSGRALAQPAALRRHEDVPALPQPRLHGQDEHGRLDRGARAAARRRAGRARRRASRRSSSCAA